MILLRFHNDIWQLEYIYKQMLQCVFVLILAHCAIKVVGKLRYFTKYALKQMQTSTWWNIENRYQETVLDIIALPTEFHMG